MMKSFSRPWKRLHFATSIFSYSCCGKEPFVAMLAMHACCPFIRGDHTDLSCNYFHSFKKVATIVSTSLSSPLFRYKVQLAIHDAHQTLLPSWINHTGHNDFRPVSPWNQVAQFVTSAGLVWFYKHHTFSRLLSQPFVKIILKVLFLLSPKEFLLASDFTFVRSNSNNRLFSTTFVSCWFLLCTIACSCCCL